VPTDAAGRPRLPHQEAEAALLDDHRPEAVARQHARGKLTARERIAALVDEGTFREIGALARPPECGPDGKPVLGDAVITGTATLDGRPLVVLATDFTVAGGSNGLVGNEKQRRAWEIAATRGIPVVMLFDGGGHRIHEGLDARDFAGGFDIHEMQTRLSGWVPMVAAILGPGYGQPTLAASMCDYVVAVRDIASVGMAPPSLVRAATGETTAAEAINSPDAQESYGTIDLAVDTEQEALDALRWYLDLLPSNAEADLRREVAAAPRAEAEAALDDAVPANLRTAYDMAEVIAGIVDEDSEVELKTGFAPNLITLLARIEGRPPGVALRRLRHPPAGPDRPPRPGRRRGRRALRPGPLQRPPLPRARHRDRPRVHDRGAQGVRRGLRDHGRRPHLPPRAGGRLAARRDGRDGGRVGDRARLPPRGRGSRGPRCAEGGARRAVPRPAGRGPRCGGVRLRRRHPPERDPRLAGRPACRRCPATGRCRSSHRAVDPSRRCDGDRPTADVHQKSLRISALARSL
jgi:acetyl-CoA carboxylase beta subunit